MGRRKKIVELSEVGHISSKSSISSRPDKKMKKWEKVIDKAFNQKIRYQDEQLFEMLNETFLSNQEVKNIISELYMKVKNYDHFVKKQWHTLKKYNLQEKIHREEGKIISQNEKQKYNEIYTEAIEKLAACHMTGFEPLNILRNKILTKLQLKYNLSEENMKDLSEHFNSNEAEDELLIQKRNDDQLAALKKMISNTSLFSYSEVDKVTYLNAKSEIKKYEKELELKASLNEITNEKISPLNQITIESETNKLVNDTEQSELFDEDESKIKLSDYMNTKGNEELVSKIGNYKQNLIDEIKGSIEKIDQGREPNEFKSFILNNLNMKMKQNGKLSHFDMQILLYIAHSVVTELIYSKNNRKDYSLDINPEELIGFLSKFKIDISQCEKQNSMTVESPLGENNDVTMNLNS